VTVPDAELFVWLKALWTGAGMRLEPSAASGFAALARFLTEAPPANVASATHVVWTTGGSHLPDAEFEAALGRA
jgi:D-serine dehydratase